MAGVTRRAMALAFGSAAAMAAVTSAPGNANPARTAHSPHTRTGAGAGAAQGSAAGAGADAGAGRQSVEPRVSKTGVLWKKRDRLDGWRQRLFVLKPDRLDYYLHPSGEFRDTFPLASIVSVSRYRFTAEDEGRQDDQLLFAINLRTMHKVGPGMLAALRSDLCDICAAATNAVCVPPPDVPAVCQY